MRREFRILNSEFRIENSPAQRRLTWSVSFLLSSILWLLTPAVAATHVTATYDLGQDARVMTTVNGTAQYGLVFVQRNKAVTYNDVQYGTTVVKGYLDATGQMNDGAGNAWLDLLANPLATPADSFYVVTINIQGRVHSEIWIVPDQPTVSAVLCRQVQTPGSTGATLAYQFLQQNGADLAQRPKLNFLGPGVSCSDNSGQFRTDCNFSGGGSASTPLASPTVTGTVKTDSSSADPVVYLKSSADSLLGGKANLSHTHAEAEVTNLVPDLAGKVPSSRTISTTAPLAGGGSLSGDLTLSMPAASGSQNGYLSATDWNAFHAKENPLTFSSPLSRLLDAVSCPTCEITANKNAASGYAGLTAGSKLNAAQGQEVWSVTDLTDYTGTSGTGSTALKSTIAAPATNDVLTWNGSNWINQAPSGSNHNLLSTTHPDTVAASPVLGDLLYGNSTPAWTKLAGNTTTTKNFLTQTGTGAASAAPSWGAIADSDLPASITRDTEINVQGTANEVVSSGPGVAPVISIASNFDISGKTSTAPVKATTAAGAPVTCTANKDLLIKTDATPAGQQLFLCNSGGNGWSLVGDGGAGGGGDNVSVNGVAATDADFDDSTPAAPANALNVKWQKDALTPNNISANVPYASPLGASGGNLTLTGVVSATLGGTGANNTATLARFLRGNGTNFVTSSGAASGTGSCTNQFVRGLNDDAAPTCATVSLTADVSGTLPSANGGTGNAFFAVTGLSATPKTFTFPDADATIEYQANKNAASGYAGLTASTKLNISQGQEVWALNDLSDVAITTPATAQTVRYNGTSWVNATLACADVTNCPSLVTSGTAGNGPSKVGDAATAARSNHDHRSVHTLTWYFPGTPSTGVQNMTLVFPEDAVNFSVLDMRVTVNTTSASSSTFNVQRCTAACTGTTPTFANIYSANLTLNASTRTAVKGAAPDQNVASLAGGDQFRANLVTIGAALADVTVTLTYKYDTTN